MTQKNYPPEDFGLISHRQALEEFEITEENFQFQITEGRFNVYINIPAGLMTRYDPPYMDLNKVIIALGGPERFHEKIRKFQISQFYLREQLEQLFRNKKQARPQPPIDDHKEIDRLFQLSGEIWTIRYKGKKCLLKDSLQLRYIAKLLESPYREWTPQQLKDAVSGIYTTDAPDLMKNGYMYSDQKSKETKVSADRETMEDAFRMVYAEATSGDVESIEKFKELKRIYSKKVSVREDLESRELKFRWSKNPNSDQNIRTNVTKQISTGRRNIADCLPELGQHLKKWLKTGNNCRYIPEDPAPKWTVIW